MLDARGLQQQHVFEASVQTGTSISIVQSKITSSNNTSRLYFPLRDEELTSSGFPERTRSKCMRASSRLPMQAHSLPISKS